MVVGSQFSSSVAKEVHSKQTSTLRLRLAFPCSYYCNIIYHNKKTDVRLKKWLKKNKDVFIFIRMLTHLIFYKDFFFQKLQVMGQL